MTTEPLATDSMWQYTLTDLIDLELLQRIQDSFAEANQVASTITDLSGNPITKFSNHSDVCLIIRDTEKGLANCIKSAQALGARAATSDKPFHQKCLSVGFTDAAAPIVVDGHHIANWLIGQYHIIDVDEKRIVEYAKEIDADADQMLSGFRSMPRLSRERFEKILDFLWLMANEISRMGYLHLQQRQQTEELERIGRELRLQKTGLENAVEARTKELQAVNATLKQELYEKDRIQQQQNRLLTAIEKLGEAITITDVRGNIIYTNPAFTEITGYSAAEVLGKNPRILKSGRHSESFYKEFWQTILSQGSWSGRFINKRKDGTLYTEESTVTTVRDENGKVVSYVAIKRDITKELELERQLLQAVKLESIGTMAAGIAHEINTPVQYLGSNLDFLDESFADILDFVSFIEQQSPIGTSSFRSCFDELDWEYLRDEIPKTFEQSKEGIRQISSIVLAMKEFAHPGSRDMALADLNRMLTNVMEVSRNEWKYVATITTSFSKTLPDIPCLADEISHTFLNIIVNAAQAISEKKTTSSCQDTGAINIITREENDSAVIIIADNGPGIPENILDKIFDPFFTTKAVGKGTGQGLAIAYDTIVKKHGGTITCKSVDGQGAEFRITLPLSAVQAGSALKT